MTGSTADTPGDVAPASGLEKKVLVRIVLPLVLFGFFGSLDKVNIGFAALQMNEALGLNAANYGFIAGVLFIGYLIAKYPSVLLLERIGMRRWLALITVSWGAAASLSGLARDATELYLLRMVIGFAEGGLSSGIVIYLSSWALERFRALALAIPMTAVSVAQVIGSPISGWLMETSNPLGLEGWRWMLLVEGVPAVLIGVAAWFYFPDRPTDAGWLTQEERARIAASAAPPRTTATTPGTRWSAVKNPFVWVCAGIWFALLATNYGIIFWLPQVIHSLGGLSTAQVGFLVSLPWIGSAIGLLVNARHSDRSGERFFHIAIPALIGAVSLMCAYLFGGSLPGLAMLILAGTATGSTMAAFWAIPSKYLDRESLPMGVVLINIVGSLAGAAVPGLMGALKDSTGTFFAPTALVCAFFLLAAALTMLARGMSLAELAAARRQPSPVTLA